MLNSIELSFIIIKYMILKGMLKSSILVECEDLEINETERVEHIV